MVTQKTNFLKGDNFSVLQQLYQTPITQKIAPLPFIIKPCVWLFGVSTAVNVSHQVARTHTSDRLLIMRKQQTYKEEKKSIKTLRVFSEALLNLFSKASRLFFKEPIEQHEEHHQFILVFTVSLFLIINVITLQSNVANTCFGNVTLRINQSHVQKCRIVKRSHSIFFFSCEKCWAFENSDWGSRNCN